MLRLRRRNHEGAEGWVLYEAYEVKNKREKLRLSYTSPQKGNPFFYTYEVFTLDCFLNGALFTTHLATKN